MARHYEKDFKLMIVDLLESGHKPKQVSEDYDIDSSTIRRWRREYQGDKEAFTGKGNLSLSPEEKEISELKKRLADTEMERDILKKAVSIFSRSDRKSTSSF